MTAAYARERKLDVELALVTPEEEPLQLFGEAASGAVRDCLTKARSRFTQLPIRVESSTGAGAHPEGGLATDRVVALPLLRGPRLDGLPQTRDGFIPVDEYGRVRDVEDVFAAGDITNFPVKQGDIATQQADTVAAAIAASAGSDVDPQPFRPVLRGFLLTGGQPRYFRQEITRGVGEGGNQPRATLVAAGKDRRPLPDSLPRHTRRRREPGRAGQNQGVAVEVEVELDRCSGAPGRDRYGRWKDGRSVADLMVPALVVAPEDTLGGVRADARRRYRFGGCRGLRPPDRNPYLTGSAARLCRARPSQRGESPRVDDSRADRRVGQATVEDAFLLMAEHGIHHLPIVDGERPIGMLGFRQVAHARPASSGAESDA